jgi:hypothetical protein
MAYRTLNLRRNDVCCMCGSALPAGSRARWDVATRTVTCAACWETGPGASESKQPEFDRGQPGVSVAREHRRRKSNREARTRETHPRIGGLLLALRAAPQHESAFHRGELGETAVATYLEKHTARGPTVLLHDRRMPGGYGNIDHLAITPNGVFVIDAKNIKGKVRVANPLFGAAKLMIRGRDRTKLIDGLDRQVHAVRRALTASGHPGMPVQGVLCFVSADLPLLGAQKMRGHLLLHRRALAKRLNKNGPLQSLAIDSLAHALAIDLPSA